MTRKPTVEQAPRRVGGLQFPAAILRPWNSIRPGVSALIDAEALVWRDGGLIPQPDLARVRRLYIKQMLGDRNRDLR